MIAIELITDWLAAAELGITVAVDSIELAILEICGAKELIITLATAELAIREVLDRAELGS